MARLERGETSLLLYGVTKVTDEEIIIVDKAIAALENSVDVSHNGSGETVNH